jgi:hypothetical protein
MKIKINHEPKWLCSLDTRRWGWLYSILKNTFYKDIIQINGKDMWDLYATLSRIILPSLIAFKNRTYRHYLSLSQYDDLDIPDQFRGGDTESELYEWLLDQMIWSFEQLLLDDCEVGLNEDGSLDRVKLNAHTERVQNGLRLFARYYTSLWT